MAVRGLLRLPLCVAFMLFLVATLCKGQQDHNPIELLNGNYHNILIAIAKEVPEDRAIIDNLKEMFTTGSRILFSATNNRVYWNSFTILVPPSWSRQPDFEVARVEAYENANIVVTESKDNHPSVLQPFGCGKQGRYIELSRQFVTGEVSLENEIGVREKVVVRQFAKLRWGVFDEHYEPDSGVTGVEPFYFFQSPNSVVEEVEGTRCSTAVEGDLVGADNHPCAQHPFTGDYPDTCRFIPHTTGQTASESLMYQSNINSIDKFCTVNNHNSQAPNAQNIQCDYQSVWEVMGKSPDFMYGLNPSAAADTDTTPVFKIVQQDGPLRVVLVLDISGSMKGERFRNMIQGTKNYILNVIPAGSQIGIVQFNHASTINSYLEEISDSASRELLVTRLPNIADGYTSIGSGILNGTQVLGHNAMETQGGVIILLSDGQENTMPFISDTLDDIKSAGVIMHTVAFWPADIQLESLATMTGGTSAACPDGGSALCVVEAFTATITRRAESIAAAVPTQVFGWTGTVQAFSTEDVSVVIDASLGKDTVFAVFWAMNPLITVNIESPDGDIIDGMDPRYDVRPNCKMISVTIDDAESGTWTVKIENSNTTVEIVDVVVTSKSTSADVDPIVVNSFLGTTSVNFTSNPFVEVYAHAHSNYEPVSNAQVIAMVESGTGNAGVVDLLDNGRGADSMAGDGVYSGYFLDFKDNGRYGVNIGVRGTSAPVQESGVDRSKRQAMGSDVTPAFTRSASGGVFQVVNYMEGLIIDILAPSKITDFTSTERTYGDDRIVNLTWTAVGDDFDQGTAAYYELRFSTDFTQLRTNFSLSPNVTERHIVSGNLSQVASSGIREYLAILLPDNDTEAIHSFAIRAWDEYGNAGRLSSITSVSKRRPPPQTSTAIPSTTATPSTNMTPSTTAIPSGGLPLAAIIAIACALLFAFVVTVVVCCCVCKCHGNAGNNPTNDYKNSAYVA